MRKNRSIITLGSFDGVHRGHQAILKKVVARARSLKAVPAALVFGIPPRFMHKRDERTLLSTLAEKKKRLYDLGIKRIQVLVFDKKTASTTPEEFYAQTILRRHQAAEMVVGPRIAFGKNRAGGLSQLRRMGRESNTRIHVIPPIGSGSHAVSSSAIRALLQAGDVEKAAKALGYLYEISGRVIPGDHRGRALGFPTANLEIDAGKMLPPGVFWVAVEPLGLDGLCNIGTRPTFTPGETKTHVEVFLFGRPGRLYGRRLRVRFLRRVRGEKKFASGAALVKQIQRDVEHVQKWQMISKRRHTGESRYPVH